LAQLETKTKDLLGVALGVNDRAVPRDSVLLRQQRLQGMLDDTQANALARRLQLL
jgi:hypothetical protein